MQLFLVRHGGAVSAGERPLSKAGIEEVKESAQFFKKVPVYVPHIYHSTKLRAKQTAEIMRDSLNPKAALEERDCLSPDDGIDDIVDDIATWKENAMIVGHLPFLSKLVSRLVLNDENISCVAFQTGSVVTLESASQKKWFIVSLRNPHFIG